MYNKEDYSPMGYETEERRPVRRRRPRKNRFFKKAAAMALSATALGLNGVWWSLSISSILKGIILTGVFLIFLWRLQKKPSLPQI